MYSMWRTGGADFNPVGSSETSNSRGTMDKQIGIFIIGAMEEQREMWRQTGRVLVKRFFIFYNTNVLNKVTSTQELRHN